MNVAQLAIAVSNMFPDKRAGADECAATGFQMSVPQMPRMDHVRPDFQSRRDVGCTSYGRKPSGVIEQRLGRANLDQYWRKAPKVGIKRRNPRVLPIYSSGKIGVSQFIQIALVDDWIYGVLAGKR